MSTGHPPRGTDLRKGPVLSPKCAPAPPPNSQPQIVIVCVPGGLRTEVVAAAVETRRAVRIIEHPAEREDGYAAVLRRLWREPREWVLLEQDTVPDPIEPGRMLECPQDWCTCPHWVGTHWETRSLGVARFSLGLRRRYPDLADQALGPRRPGDPPKHWRVCDTELARVLAILGVAVHVHPTRTRHLHDYGV